MKRDRFFDQQASADQFSMHLPDKLYELLSAHKLLNGQVHKFSFRGGIIQIYIEPEYFPSNKSDASSSSQNIPDAISLIIIHPYTDGVNEIHDRYAFSKKIWFGSSAALSTIFKGQDYSKTGNSSVCTPIGAEGNAKLCIGGYSDEVCLEQTRMRVEELVNALAITFSEGKLLKPKAQSSSCVLS